MPGFQQMTSNSDQVVNESIGKGKSLRMAMGFASPHLPLLLPGRLMGDFNTIILPFALPMHEAWRDLFKAQKHFAGND